MSSWNEANCGLFIKSSNPEDLKEAILNITTLNLEDIKQLGENGKKWIYENRKYSKLANEYINKILDLRK